MTAAGEGAARRPRGAAKKEAFFRAAEADIQPFSPADGAAQLLQVRGDARDGSNKRVDVGQRHEGYGRKEIADLPG